MIGASRRSRSRIQSCILRGYVVDEAQNRISAWFAKEGEKAKRGVRMPRPTGGMSKRYYEGLDLCSTADEKAEYKRSNAEHFTPRSKRFGLNDPDI